MTDTNEEDKPKRPNANYKLSKPEITGDIKEEDLPFYYNRDRRLAKAPQSVRDLYAEVKKKHRFNLLRPLIADKPRAMLFFTILFMCAAIFILSKLGFFDSSYSLEGNQIEIKANGYEGTTIITLKKDVKKPSSAYSGSVDIAVFPVAGEDEEYPVFYHRIFFSQETEEEYSFVVPFSEPELMMALQTEKKNIRVKLKPK